MKMIWIIIALGIASCDKSGFKGNSATAPASSEGLDSGAMRTLLESQGIIDVGTLAKACAEAPSLESLDVTIRFPERRDCQWNQGQNLDRRDAFVQAFEQTERPVTLPDGSVLCGMNLKSKPGISLHYDDFLFLTLENHVLFGTNRLVTAYLDQKNEVYSWEFEKMRGKPIENFEAPAYCLAPSARCQLPPHDQSGPVSLELTPAETAPIAFVIADGRTNISFRLLATGDNDDRDCFHTDLDLDVRLDYLEL